MKKLSFLIVFVLMLASFAVMAQTPELRVGGKAFPKEVSLQKLNIEVNVVGNFAVTTMTMTFKNNSSQILEGELLFPLPEGVTVSRYALDINGKMREAVPVEKAKATQVFEEIERRNVDPGILERVEGNNFRTRIYPFMANASRTILISYEQELSVEDNNLQYRLPMDYKTAIEDFSLQITVQRQEKSPIIKESPDNKIRFDKQGINYVANFSRKNYQPDKRLTFAVPVSNKEPQILMQSAESSFYFYVNQFMPSETKPKTWSDKIGIIWDVSLSGLQRDIEHELELLGELISKKQNLDIEVYTLAYTFENIGTFTIKNGDWTALKTKLQSLVYDGGTNYASIDLSKSTAGEFLLFSDGLSTLSEATVNTSKPVHCVVSSPKADYSNLKWIAAQSRGKFINLNALTKKQASELLMEDPLMFLGIKSNNALKEVYPSVSTPVQGNISLCGISNSNNTNITLLFGFGNVVLREETITLDGGKFKTTDMDVYRMWAQKKIAEMDMRYDKHKDEIIELGQYFGIVTRGTSLMVLETLEDYIRYRIYPPEELREAYDKRMKQDQDRLKQQIGSLLDNAKKATKELQTWWNTEFKAPEPPKYPQPDNRSRSDNRNNNSRALSEDSDVRISVATVEESEASGIDIAELDVHMVVAEDRREVVFEPGEVSSSQRVSSEAKKEKATVAPKATIIIADIKQDQDYLTALTGDIEKDYAKYLELRPNYISTSTFYFDMASWFYSHGHKEKALQILSNIAEIDIENHSLFKTLAYKLKEYGAYEQEVFICKKVLDWRPMEPQSYRDYGLALADVGNYQQALNQLYAALTQNFAQSVSSISRGIEEILVTEINQLHTLYKNTLNTDSIDKDILFSMPVDIRVVLNWNMPNTDIDLHITDPTREVCYYQNKRTKIGGRISPDITQGYGPEQFMLKKAISGKYKIEINYFGDRQVKSEGPTTVMAEIYLYYADKRQERKIVTLHMSKQTKNDSGRVLVGEFSFE